MSKKITAENFSGTNFIPMEINEGPIVRINGKLHAAACTTGETIEDVFSRLPFKDGVILIYNDKNDQADINGQYYLRWFFSE